FRLKVRYTDCADDPVVANHWSEDGRTEAKLARELLSRQRHLRIVLNLGVLENLFAQHCATAHRIFIERTWVIVDQLLTSGLAVNGGHLDHPVVKNLHACPSRSKQSQEISHNRVEYGLGIGH